MASRAAVEADGRQRGATPASTVAPRVAGAHDAQLQRRVDHAGVARGIEQALRRSACDGTIAKPVGPHELWPIAATCIASVPTCPLQQPADAGAGEHVAALRGSEVRAQQLLHARDAGGEGRELGARGAGQHAHQHLVADARPPALRQRRQCQRWRASPARPTGRAARSSSTTTTRHAAGSARRASSGARRRRRRRAAVDQQAAVVEAGDADARAPAAPEPGRQRGRCARPGRASARTRGRPPARAACPSRGRRARAARAASAARSGALQPVCARSSCRHRGRPLELGRGRAACRRAARRAAAGVISTSVSEPSITRPRLPKRRPSVPDGSRKPRCNRPAARTPADAAVASVRS